ncbi:Serine/threonine-protein phosphatase 2A activator 1 [Rhodotorula kratochvilovae]
MNTPDLPPLTALPKEAPEPVRKIYAAPDLEEWIQSKAYDDIERFIQRLRTASTGPISEPLSQPLQLLLNFLAEATAWINEPDPSTTSRKNREAFQAWLDKVDENTAVLHRDLVDEAHAVALPEMRIHLLAAFGSAQRLDYGTGHELSFLAYLLVLRLVGILTPEDELAVARRIFAGYLDLVGKVQRGFKLEPAGKLGVWGVDEHQHLVYHWGASQARIHPSKRPLSLLSPPNASPHRIAYLFLTTLLHLNRDPWSAPPSPEEEAGLLRLYRAEVLQRLPVVQHFRFGAILRWVHATSHDPLPSTGDGLDPAAQDALSAALDARVRDDGTVAPWALPALSGELPAQEMLEHLPSPITGSPPSPSSSNRPSIPPSPSFRTSPLPYSAGTPSLGPRRASRLSISESFEEARAAEEAGAER